mgnify:CR=1 FL=1
MHGELKDYRQPMVTSVGIMLGFLLNFLAGWGIRSGEAIGDLTDAVILTTTVAAVVGMVATLYRILNADLGTRDPAHYYRVTLRLYAGSIVVAVGGSLLAILF